MAQKTLQSSIARISKALQLAPELCARLVDAERAFMSDKKSFNVTLPTKVPQGDTIAAAAFLAAYMDSSPSDKRRCAALVYNPGAFSTNFETYCLMLGVPQSDIDNVVVNGTATIGVDNVSLCLINSPSKQTMVNGTSYYIQADRLFQFEY